MDPIGEDEIFWAIVIVCIFGLFLGMATGPFVLIGG